MPRDDVRHSPAVHDRETVLEDEPFHGPSPVTDDERLIKPYS